MVWVIKEIMVSEAQAALGDDAVEACDGTGAVPVDMHPEFEAMADEVVECSGGSRGTIYAALRDAFRMGREGLTYAELQAAQKAEKAALPPITDDDLPF